MLPEMVDRQRHMYIAKSNVIVRTAKFNLSVKEHRVLAFFLSAVKPGDDGQADYSYSIRQFCAVAGLNYRDHFSSVKDTVKSLRDQSLWITTPDGKETLVSFIEKVYLHRNSDKITIRFDRDLLPFLINLKDSGNFTQYELFPVLAFKCKFSFRFYELFKSWESLGYYVIGVDELRSILVMGDAYPKFADFRRYVIDQALAEINKYTDLEVEYSPILHGRKVDEVSFSIKRKENFDKNYQNVRLALGEGSFKKK